jgi:hypothetical protein
MPYEHRFGCTSRRNDCRHDPGYAGIPTRNKLNQEIDLSKTHPIITGFPKPTFESAVVHTKALRNAIPALNNCPIFACTDLQMDTTHSGRVAVQRIA